MNTKPNVFSEDVWNAKKWMMATTFEVSEVKKESGILKNII